MSKAEEFRGKESEFRTKVEQASFEDKMTTGKKDLSASIWSDMQKDCIKHDISKFDFANLKEKKLAVLDEYSGEKSSLIKGAQKGDHATAENTLKKSLSI